MNPNGKRSLVVLNADAARFRCVWPSCEGVCCKNGRPPVREGEAARIAGILPQVLPLVRPEARRAIEARGWLTRRIKSGMRTIAVADGYCVFYAEGCVLHKLGAAEGDKHRYKPASCISFPLDRDDHGRWYVRQKDFAGETWDLFCLDPASAPDPIDVSLRDEIAFAERLEAGFERWREGR
jgi:hypothetical protein